jgi:hypothetical protein
VYRTLWPEPLNPKLSGLCAVVRVRRLLEPWVREGLFGCDASGRIIDEDLLEQIQEELQELVVVGDDVLLAVSACEAEVSQRRARGSLHPASS